MVALQGLDKLVAARMNNEFPWATGREELGTEHGEAHLDIDPGQFDLKARDAKLGNVGALT